MPAMYTAHAFQRPLEREFVVVHWDQRGAGKSFRRNLDTRTLTASQLVSDGLEVVERLKRDFGVEKVVLVGHSHGSWLGPQMVRARPDLFHAYVGVGQVGDPDREHQVQDELIRARLAARGEPAAAISPDNRETLLFRVGGELAGSTSMLPLVITGLLAPEYSLADVLNVPRGPQLATSHFRYDLPGGYGPPAGRLEVPVTVIMGKADAVTPVSLARTWFDHLQAPSKRWVELEDAAHFPHLEQPDAFARAMRQVKQDMGGGGVRPVSALPVPRLGLHCR